MTVLWSICCMTLILNILIPSGWKLNSRLELETNTKVDIYKSNIWRNDRKEDTALPQKWELDRLILEGGISKTVSAGKVRTKSGKPKHFSSKLLNNRVRARNGNIAKQLRIGIPYNPLYDFHSLHLTQPPLN